MIALIGKSLLYILTACALVGVGSQIIKGPDGVRSSGETLRLVPSPERATGGTVRPHCDYVQFAQKGDTTYWEDRCYNGAHPWDTVTIVRPDP